MRGVRRGLCRGGAGRCRWRPPSPRCGAGGAWGMARMAAAAALGPLGSGVVGVGVGVGHPPSHSNEGEQRF